MAAALKEKNSHNSTLIFIIYDYPLFTFVTALGRHKRWDASGFHSPPLLFVAYHSVCSNMAFRNPPPRPNLIASHVDGYIIFVAYPRFQSGLRVPPNQIFKLLQTRALDLECFCGRISSAFRSTKKDSLLNRRFVAMCKKKECNYFIDLTGTYDEALYLWPVHSSNAAPGMTNSSSSSTSTTCKSSNTTTCSSNTMMHSSNTTMRSSSRQRVKDENRSQ
ncbi:hypothetical protein F5878DRAFT_666528 [Lentinula raphanica]|uniref:Uncharacterized protein n=1 Tax=Lentinula raphanica TaxID=153919 RepID=A0AA38NXK0_9AGAR|nr:hypothetical protein F5878DRAFT_666528 [Lentinula raphanica]